VHRHELAYEHPDDQVAQRPAPRREDARLLHVGVAGPLRHLAVSDLAEHVVPGEVLVVNDSRVRPCRLQGRKESGGAVEILLLDQRADGTWAALVGAARTPGAGARIRLPDGVAVTVLRREAELFILRAEGDLDACLERRGLPPLPPYVRRAADSEDRQRYQTTYARPHSEPLGSPGASAAAPTAGLHLTEGLLAAIEARGARVVRVALGVGAATFRPVQRERVEDHRMHEEPFAVPDATADAVNEALAAGRRVTSVGTTALRVLEAAASPGGRVRALRGRTGLFLLPGCRLRTATRLLTNFHQPGSTLLALVSGFAGALRVRAAYAAGVAAGYRLFSYGDAMLLERSP
jgi:S-adenosylmethionine:tRNA ribosyltransferase-isomerase